MSAAETATATCEETAAQVGQVVCDRGTRRLRRLAVDVERTAGRRFRLDGRRRLTERLLLRDPDLGWRSVEALRTEADSLEAGISAETTAGSLRHRRLPRFLRHVPAAIVTADFVVLASYTADVFDVNWRNPTSTWPQLIVAVVFAIIGTGTAYAWLSLTGHRLRSFRDRRGEVTWSLLGATTWLILALAVVLLASLGALMAVRVHAEILSMGLRSPSATPVAAVFAVIAVVANCAVVAVHALDGSDQTERLTTLRRLAHKRETRLARYERRLLRLDHRLLRLARRARRDRTLLAVRAAGRVRQLVPASPEGLAAEAPLDGGQRTRPASRPTGRRWSSTTATNRSCRSSPVEAPPGPETPTKLSGPGPQSLSGRRLQREQAALRLGAAPIGPRRPVRAHDPMAGDDEGNGVQRARGTDRPDRPGAPGPRRELAVADGPGVRDVDELLEHRAAEPVGQLQIHRDVEGVPASGEVLVELARDLVEAARGAQHPRADLVGEGGEHGVGVLHREGHPDQPGGRGREQQPAERRVEVAVGDVEQVLVHGTTCEHGLQPRERRRLLGVRSGRGQPGLQRLVHLGHDSS